MTTLTPFFARLGSVLLMAAVLYLPSVHADPSGPPPLRGLWLATQRSSGGLGTSLTFKDPGRVVADFGAIIESRYTVQGADWVLQEGDDEKSRLRLTLAADGQSLSWHDPETNQPVAVLLRIGAATAPPSVVGVWRHQSPYGAPAELVVNDHGQALYRILMKQREGTVQVDPDGSIRLNLDGEPWHIAQYDTHRLEMRDSANRTWQFKSFDTP